VFNLILISPWLGFRRFTFIFCERNLSVIILLFLMFRAANLGLRIVDKDSHILYANSWQLSFKDIFTFINKNLDFLFVEY